MEPNQMIAELRELPDDRLSDWDRSFIATCAAALEQGELDERRTEKLAAVHADRTKTPEAPPEPPATP